MNYLIIFSVSENYGYVAALGRRVYVIGFLNGIPLVFVELKNVHKSVHATYEENPVIYKERVPQLFYHKALCILGNGIEAVFGAFSSP